MAFPESFVEDVRRAADIVRVISEQVPLKKMGSSWKGLCPFHKEKTPSFNVRSDPPVFHCFGCGAGGDVFKFVMLHERASFPEAVEAVAKRFGIPLPEGRSEAGPDRKQREALFALMEAATTHFARNFWNEPGAKAREYLLGRGFARETLERIRAGAARDSWDDLLQALRGRFSVPSLASAGLVLERQDHSGHYDRFRNRAIFPILDETGKAVAFGARSLDGSDPKYLNSPETPIYQKSRTVYGLSWARDAIRRLNRVVLMEGYLDVARAIESGVEEAVASCGTALTPGHARLLRRFTDRVIVNFDQDTAGQKATRRSLDVLVEEGFSVRVVVLPEGHDPDTFLKASGADAYRERLEQAPSYLDWLIEQAARQHDVTHPEGKAAYLAELLPTLARIESAVERAAWLPAVVARGGLDDPAAREELRRAVASRATTVPAAVSAPPPPRAEIGLIPAERWLLELALCQDTAAIEALRRIEDGDLQDLRSADVLRAARELSRNGVAVTVPALEQMLGDDETRRLLREIAVQASTTGAHADDCMRELRRRALGRRLARIQERLQAAGGAEDDALLEEKQSISRQIASS